MSLSHRRTRLIMLVVLVPLLSTRALGAQAGIAQDTLWAKAVALAKANQGWVPASWHEEETVYNKKGKVEETTELQLRFGATPDGNIDVHVEHATKNGKDNVAAAQRTLEQYKDAYLRDNPEDNLFDPSIQHTITARRTSEVKQINGRTYVGFSYTQTIQEGDWSGIAWLDAETGWPIQVESAPELLPIKEEGIEIQALKTITHYDVGSHDAWYPVTVQVEADFKGKYAFFSYEGTSKSTITLSGYERF